MAESPRRLDLRLTVSGSAPYGEIAAELAARFAEYAGASQADARAVSKTVAAAIASVDGEAVPVDVRVSAVNGAVTVTTAPSAD
jgi:hypothetical protein